MSRDLLLEIGCEEIPARFVESTVQQLSEKLAEWLQANRITFGEYRTYATPRRLVVFVSNVMTQQEDRNEEVKGPSARIAQPAEGSWSKAAEGFARKVGVTVEDLYFQNVQGETYVFAHVHQRGELTTTKLEEGLPAILSSLQFPKAMRWGSNRTRFIRPVRWMVCLFGEEVVPFEWAGVRANQLSYGHRFLGNEALIHSARSYFQDIQREYVIVDAGQRRESIQNQLKQLEQQNGWVIPVDPGLMAEVVQLVEYPTALAGQFSEEFLVLPREVLITTMREHQRYFPVESRDGRLLPYFVTVRNGDTYEVEKVARGNEKVLRARLSDARFFYEEDLKLPIDTALAKLDQIVYQEELGSVGDRVRRVEKIALELGKQLKLTPTELANLQRAARICKFDLATQMVNEFPELEGTMGSAYARNRGEKEEVVQAVYEHYLPRTSGDALPKSKIGTILSLADKMDVITASFGIGVQPTGSQDPYGLRRRGQSIVQILTQQVWSSISLEELYRTALDQLEQAKLLKVKRGDVERDLYQFFGARIKAVMQEEEIRYDIMDAVLAGGLDNVWLSINKAQVLMAQIEADSFKKEVEGFTRAANLATKAGNTPLYAPGFREASERALSRALDESRTMFKVAQEIKDPIAMYEAIAHLATPIHHFFDSVMVMVEDAQVRNNRLALLREIAQHVKQFAAFEMIVFPS